MEDREWEAMKSGSEEYRLFLQERERAKEPTNGRHAHEQPWPQRDERWWTTVQRCHSCGWLGTPILPQQCPECKALDILSVHAEPHDTESERRGTPDTRHPPATTPDYPSSPLKGESSTTTPDEESGGFQRHERGDESGFGLGVRGTSKLFDDKVPMNDEYRTDGGADSIDRWRHKTRGYFIGKVPALLPLLDWAERREHQAISIEDVTAETSRAGTLTPAETSAVNGAVWTFLQMCTTGGASDVMNLVPELNGMEAWRALMVMANRGRNLR